MAASSVTGSFRGIDVSFAYKGPHIVMSVLNNKEDGRRLRVMFQQQPLSGRVNWVSFQLTRHIQDVVVPAEVIHSHKLAFYVDNHEPIATYTEKILDELKQIQELQISETDLEDSAYNPLEPADDDTDDVNSAIQDGTSENNANENIASEIDIASKKIESTKSNPDVEEPDQATLQSIQQNSRENVIDQSNVETRNDDAIPNNNVANNNVANNNVEANSHQEKVAANPTAKEKKEKATNTAKSNSEDYQGLIPQRKKQHISKYVPSVSTELKFKIKVPSLPKSATQMQTTFIPPRTAFSSKVNSKKNGFIGQLVGTFGFTFSSRKKEYYIQQHRHLYEKFHSELEKLESDYNNGCGISLDNWDLESLNEQETAILLLNLMVNEISAWKKVAKKGKSDKEDLVNSLQKIEDELKYTLKQTRGMQAPTPTLFPDRTAMTDQDLMNIQADCDTYLKRFSEKLASLEQKHADKVRIPVFKKFLIEFVRDKLFPSVAEFSDLPSVQTRLNWFLDLVEYEIIPIEPGKTKISQEHHDVKEKRDSEFESETVVEVITPGLQTKGGKRVVQNAVVIQAG